jgi:hypothetical protein
MLVSNILFAHAACWYGLDKAILADLQEVIEITSHFKSVADLLEAHIGALL